MRRVNLKSLCLLFVFAAFTCTFTGCEAYDWLVNWIQKSFAPDYAYDVSVVDCKHLKEPEQVLLIKPSFLENINSGMRQAVKTVGTKQSSRNITLTDSIPSEQFQAFQNGFFNNTTFQSKNEMLRDYCTKYQTNIIMWGVSMGDDANLAFMGWMYRRDLDTIVQTKAIPFSKKESERVQIQKIQDAMEELLENSLNDSPIGAGGKIAKEMRENKETILNAVTAILLYGLSGGGGGI